MFFLWQNPDGSEASCSRTTSVYVCNECILLCNEIMAEDLIAEEHSKFGHIPKPKEIKNFLINIVLIREHAKKILAVAVHNHYKRIFANANKSDVELQKSNILLIGLQVQERPCLHKHLQNY